MKKFILLMVALSAMPLVFAQGIELTNNLGSSYPSGDNINGYITIPKSDIVKVDVSLVVPFGAYIEKWSAQGNGSVIGFEQFNSEYMGQTLTFGHWNFSGPISSDFIISYEVKPVKNGDQNITLLWITPAGFGRVENKVLVSSEEGAVKGGVSAKPGIMGISSFVALAISVVVVVILAVIVFEVVKNRKMKKFASNVRHEEDFSEVEKELERGKLRGKAAEGVALRKKTMHSAKKKVKTVGSKSQKKVVLKSISRTRKVATTKKSYSTRIKQLENIRKSLE